MTLVRLHSLTVGLLSLLTLTSCSLISETGPLKGKITDQTKSYTLIEVKSRDDIPSSGRIYGIGQAPAPAKGQAYSDRIRYRDALNFIITDLAEDSPFGGNSKGEPYNFGPVEVPEDGLIDIPYVGTIQVINQTLSQASSELGEKIKPISNTARPAVFRSDRMAKVANVIGDVKKPGPVPLDRPEISSVDLLSMSGGPENAEYLCTYTMRRNGKDYPFDYLAFRQRPFPIEEGDLLSVAADTTNRFHVMGAINKPTTIPFPVPSPTLADALGSASGLDERRSDPSGVFIFRKGSTDTVYTFNLKDPAVIHLVQRFPIQGNDIVYVTEAPLTRWSRLISQILPISISQAANSAARYATN